MSQADVVPPHDDLQSSGDGHKPSDRELLHRFANGRQESAFETLVRRHGPVVQGVCRRVLGDVHAAEDAFQATFLVLVRKAGEIRCPELLANWLYGVAYRIAHKARVKDTKRETLERQAAEMATREANLDVEWNELKAVLDEELSRLPEKYRAPLVLCYLEGMTNVEAARHLGWPDGSISERLARGREALRKRLDRRGLTLSAGLLALLLSQKAASADVPSALVDSTVTAAVIYAGHPAAVGTVSGNVVRMANAALKATLPAYLKLSAAAVLSALALLVAFSSMREAFGGSRILPFGDRFSIRLPGAASPGTPVESTGCGGSASP